MATSFSAQVEEWVKESKEAILAVVQESAQRVTDRVLLPTAKGGNMPVDTGFLRSSFKGSLNQPFLALRDKPEGNLFTYDGSDVILTIAGMELGDTFYGTFTANYAVYVEYGANGRPPRAMVRTAAAQWQAIVNEVTLELKTRLS